MNQKLRILDAFAFFCSHGTTPQVFSEGFVNYYFFIHWVNLTNLNKPLSEKHTIIIALFSGQNRRKTGEKNSYFDFSYS